MDVDHTPASPRVRKYATSRRGPEAALMRSIMQWAKGPRRIPSRWAATGIAIGAGEPDLVLVDFRPDLRGMGSLSDRHIRVLAFLAEMGAHEVCDIAFRSGLLREEVEKTLDDLAHLGAFGPDGGGPPWLCPEWQDILTDTIAIEAKVSDWRRGAAQAARNRIFAARSYLAMPPTIATRIAQDSLIDDCGIGVIAVGRQGCVTIVREAPRQRPLIWYYYFSLALAVAASLGRKPRGVRRCD